jgi:hypothetical protein
MLYMCQAERLSEFYEICRNLDIGRGEKFIKVEQVGYILYHACFRQGFSIRFYEI